MKKVSKDFNKVSIEFPGIFKKFLRVSKRSQRVPKDLNEVSNEFLRSYKGFKRVFKEFLEVLNEFQVVLGNSAEFQGIPKCGLGGPKRAGDGSVAHSALDLQQVASVLERYWVIYCQEDSAADWS